MIETKIFYGDIYDSYTVHRMMDSDSLDIDYDYYSAGCEYFISEGVILYTGSKGETYYRPDPILSSKIFETCVNKERDGNRKLEIGFSSRHNSSYILKSVSEDESFGTFFDNYLYSEDIFGGDLFEIRKFQNYNYENNLGGVEDSYQINLVPRDKSEGIPMSPSSIKEDKIRKMARKNNLYEATEIEDINRK